MIKMLVTDIDGTILDHKNECSKNMRAALKELQKRGIKVVLASGRMYQGAAPVAKELGLDTPIICSQGAIVKHNGEVLWQAPVKHELARDVIEFLRSKKIHTNLYNGEDLIVENDEYMDEYCYGRFVTYHVADFDDVELTTVSKLLAIVPDEDEMLKLISELSTRYNGVLSIVRSHKLYCEITDKDATKGNALRFVAKYFGFKEEEVMASGDQDNDYEMLKAAGVSVAMGNASPRLKEIADYVCPCIEEDGLVKAVERFVLCE